MAQTIKEKMILALQTQLQTISGGSYNRTFTDVVRAAPRFDVGEIAIWPRYYLDEERVYSADRYDLDIRIQATDAVATSEVPDIIANEIEGDLIECVFGEVWHLAYTLGDSGANDPDDMLGASILAGACSLLIESYTVTAGAWSIGTAVGVISCRRKSGAYTATPIPITITGVGTFVGGVLTAKDKNVIIFPAPLEIQGLDFTGGGVIEYPEAESTAVSVALDVRLRFRTLPGNPYTQP